jgi:D-galactarolactone cycloisomerase
LHWIEEPLPADSSSADWLACKKILNKPLAGGENLRSDDFKTQAAWLDIVQPDVGKWGGISANWGIAKLAIEQGKTYCPHWLGSGLGLMASAHLLAAIGGNGLLEIDVNENPLREILAQTLPAVSDGLIKLSTLPGIGVVPNLELASTWLTNYQETIL